MIDSLIHKNKKNKDSLISLEPEQSNKKCCNLKCCALTGLSLFCLVSVSGLIYVNIVCGSFTNNLCDINHYCPNYSPCDSGSGL